MKNFFALILLVSFLSFSQNEGQIIVKGKMIKAKSGKLYLYEIIGKETYILDSTIVNSGTFQFKPKNYIKGFYKLAFNNETNGVEIVLNPNEGSVFNITFNVSIPSNLSEFFFRKPKNSLWSSEKISFSDVFNDSNIIFTSLIN